jgi:hypothetical protein
LREEELKWYERANVKTLLEGDANTRFFHLVANSKHRKQQIYRLEYDNGVIVSFDRLKSHITNYYKNLFGIPEQTDIALLEDQIHDIPQVFDEENEILIVDFTERLSSKWSIIRLLHRMASQLNSIKFSGGDQRRPSGHVP